jgi:hypothetical protein
MPRRVDEGKLLWWQKRLTKFESSGLSVAAFCRQQKIAATQFYYWQRRIREAAPVGNEFGMESAEKTAPVAQTSWAEVVVGESVRVRLPQDPQLICAVAQALQASARAKPSFERIDVLSSR